MASYVDNQKIKLPIVTNSPGDPAQMHYSREVDISQVMSSARDIMYKCTNAVFSSLYVTAEVAS